MKENSCWCWVSVVVVAAAVVVVVFVILVDDDDDASAVVVVNDSQAIPVAKVSSLLKLLPLQPVRHEHSKC